MPGKGNLMLTGQLGEIMQESAQAALTYLRSMSDDWDLDPEIFERTDIHIHFPEGGIPKDGPSGGITIATALISAFTDLAVYRDVAMTGEITLRGRILPVGGVKEKLLAAHRAGVKKVMLPLRNGRDLQEVPKTIRRNLEIILVETMDKVLEDALVPSTETDFPLGVDDAEDEAEDE
jgi:ATP-dependent Lon protease